MRSPDLQPPEINSGIKHFLLVPESLEVHEGHGLGHLDARSPVNAAVHQSALNFHQQISCDGVRAGNNLADGFKPVHLVAMIDALGRIAHVKISGKAHAGFFFQQRMHSPSVTPGYTVDS